MYDQLKNSIKAVIKENGTGAITGDILQSSLLSMVNSLGNGALLKGVAIPSTNPGTPEGPEAYLATGTAVFPNFSAFKPVSNGVHLLTWNGTKWVGETVYALSIGEGLMGDGTASNPLKTNPATLKVAVGDGLTGDGTSTNPIKTNPSTLKVSVGDGLSGNGSSGSPIAISDEVFKDVITQGLGDSSNKAMSQKAVTDELNKLGADLNILDMDINGTIYINIPSTINGTFLYKLVPIEKGKTYNFNLNLNNAIAAAMFWNIKVNNSTMLFPGNMQINAGDTTSSLSYISTNNYDIVELWLYCGSPMPSMVLNMTSNINMESRLQGVESSTSVLEKSYASAGEFYMNAWVRFSDGFISGSSAGAKIYKIKKTDIASNATKIIANVSTENTEFAAIAFYSSDTPETTSYLQSVSIQGKNEKTGAIYEANIPENWVCALVLNMSQYFPNPSIKIDSLSILTLDDATSKVNEAKSLVNIFHNKPFYHHLNQEMTAPRQSIPAQSLLDITYARMLGADLIEVNQHACSDGIYVCKHGESNTLGQGIKAVDGLDYSSTLFSAVTSTWIRNNITYSCNRSKYETFIPTLDEFCSKCKQEAMKIKIGNDVNALNIARKYLPDDMIFMTANTRLNGFRGTIEYVWSLSTSSVDDCITYCKKIGAPLQITIASGAIDTMTDDDVKSIVNAAHINGFGVGVVYTSTNLTLHLLKLGVDSICSSYRQINLFNEGNAINIRNISDSKLIKNGTTYNSDTDTLFIPSGGNIYIPADNSFDFGKISVHIRFSGKITVSCGTDVSPYNLQEYVSDGNEPISWAVAISPDSPSKYTNWLYLLANLDTTIYDIKVSCSIM